MIVASSTSGTVLSLVLVRVQATTETDSASAMTMQIEVQTYKDSVQLSGYVATPEMLVRAGEIARQVSGVLAVQNNLMVK